MIHSRFLRPGLVLLISFIISGVFAGHHADTQPATAQDDGALPTEAAIRETIIPERDLSDLAIRLRGITEIPPAPTSPVRAYAIGAEESFFVHNFNEVITVTARLAYVNERVYMWVERGFAPDPVVVQQAADIFATQIYPDVRAVFGSESTPGVDGDPRIHILNSAQLGPGIAGYYYSQHQYPVEAVPTSNAREMYFAGITYLENNSDFYLEVLAHEFQHMIHFANDANEESWINEGLSELATYVAGYTASGHLPSYLAQPSIQLTYWPEGYTSPIYGGGFLYALYLSERFGLDFISALVAHPENGMDGVHATLADLGITDPQSGQPLTAEQVFAEWITANWLNNQSIADGRFGYEDHYLQQVVSLEPSHIFEGVPATLINTINQWGAQYFTIRGNDVAGQTLTIDFAGSDTAALLPIGAYSGNYAFWSNRANLSDTRLTRTVDLSNVDTATLTFWTWYDIEADWDYAYVVVSVDSGNTWSIMPTPRTTATNPNGNNYGHGYTSASEGWVQESIDLSAFAGQSDVQIRFEYITDDATLQNGMLIDDVAIPEIGFFDDFEAPDDTWTIEGWVRVDNVLQQRYAFILIEALQDGSARVHPLLGAEDGTTLAQSIAIGEDVRDVTLVMTAFAPITTQPASFSLQLGLE